MPTNLAIIGSTGSLGQQTLEVVRAHESRFKVLALATHKNIDLLEEQINEFLPAMVAVYDEAQAQKLAQKIAEMPATKRPQLLSGNEGWIKLASHPEIEKIVFVSSGLTALESLETAIVKGKQIALANKEVIVAAGELIMQLAKQYDVTIVPIDSEHSGLFQCLQGEDHANIEKVILTCSGGPFYGKTQAELRKMTAKEALRHPTWNMGQKITIDSATLMNKGFEIIEAKHLFGLKEEQIEIVIHPESIVHSFVIFKDGNIKAQLSLPDMRLPITYALGYPERLETNWPRLDISQLQKLTFLKPDFEIFQGPTIAYQISKKGGNLPLALALANNEAVEEFLQGKIEFLQIYERIHKTLNEARFMPNPDLSTLKNLIP